MGQAGRKVTAKGPKSGLHLPGASARAFRDRILVRPHKFCGRILPKTGPANPSPGTNQIIKQPKVDPGVGHTRGLGGSWEDCSPGTQRPEYTRASSKPGPGHTTRGPETAPKTAPETNVMGAETCPEIAPETAPESSAQTAPEKQPHNTQNAPQTKHPRSPHCGNSGATLLLSGN